MSIRFAVFILSASLMVASAASPALTCSPAPCVLPNVQVSEVGNSVSETPIASNPANPSHGFWRRRLPW